ncbi:MAG: hypothetical protein ACREKN_08985 [Longimicrobiaceae bacterium]
MAKISVSQHSHATNVDWRAALWSGVIAGAVFMILEMMMVPIFLGDSAWAPPRMIAAIVLGQDVLPPPATFDLGILMVAMVVHFVLSILFAIILALLIARRSLGKALAVGAAFGFGLYLVNFYGFTALFPWFAMARNWVSIVAHVLFGLIAAWSYHRLAGHPAAA